MKSIRSLVRPYDALLLVVALVLAALYIRAAGGGFPLDGTTAGAGSTSVSRTGSAVGGCSDTGRKGDDIVGWGRRIRCR